ncbi:GNAT family N-acetyltransferase [Paenibacillus qinlingensis]|uniref:RimJ/RimL family protein N-acetyltransferase n=1 Tax=Paenibacillus qinlingensis TaxID=1837343 RepID=A0ABU1P3S4_9BACL|nr:GNAT family N-acetyltransferase [Paenibacillus qinlingensis]MDR6554410.1 RimJ/RimL family protein N-acetyltransferase [Paenibacillus qinlingensis]
MPQPITLTLPWYVVPLTETACQELCTWRYPAPYAIYNWPSWETMLDNQSEFADPLIRDEQYRGVVDINGTLLGFVQFFPIVGVTRLGLGLRPDLCGQGGANKRGLGTQFVQLLVAEAQRRSPEQEIDLEVLVWNERAIRAYQRAGFTMTDNYEKWTPTGPADFHCMVYTGPTILLAR